jgi:hypothetical protein
MTDLQAELRKRWKQYCKASEAWSVAWAAQGRIGAPPTRPPYSDDLGMLTCGAKTRAGTPCKRRDLYASGRCKLHGGMSTGPRKYQTP